MEQKQVSTPVRQKQSASYVDVRRWCPLWSKKFPSFCHDPVQNFTYCRICRHSNITESKVSLWAIGQGPPLSGWRVRRLMRHLYSTEHTAAREVALEVCRKSAEIELLEDEHLQISERLKLGSPEDLFGIYEAQDNVSFSSEDQLTFKELARLLNVEISMMNAHNNKQKSNGAALNKRKSATTLPMPNQSPHALKKPRHSDLENAAGSIWIDTQQSEGADTLLHNGTFHQNHSYLARDDENGSFYDSSNDVTDAPNQAAGAGDTGGPLFADDNGLSLPDTLASIAQSQLRLSAAVENLVEVQTNIFVVLKELISAMKPDS